MKIKKIEVLPFVKVSFYIIVSLGLIIGIIFGLISELLVLTVGLKSASQLSIILFSLVIIPLSLSLVTVIGSFIFVMLYNFFSEMTGGLSLEVE